MEDQLLEILGGVDVVGEAGQQIDYSQPFPEGRYTIKVESFDDWEVENKKNYEVKKYNFKTRKSELIETIPNLKIAKTRINFEIIETQEDSEECQEQVGRLVSEFISSAPNTLFKVQQIVAAVFGEGMELSLKDLETMLAEQPINVYIKNNESKKVKTKTDPVTGKEETEETVSNYPEISQYYVAKL